MLFIPHLTSRDICTEKQGVIGQLACTDDRLHSYLYGSFQRSVKCTEYIIRNIHNYIELIVQYAEYNAAAMA